MSEETEKPTEKEGWESPPIGELFYLLRKSEGEGKPEITLHEKMKTAVKMIGEYMAKKISHENIDLMRISLEEDKLKAERVSWGEITFQLIQSEEEK